MPDLNDTNDKYVTVSTIVSKEQAEAIVDSILSKDTKPSPASSDPVKPSNTTTTPQKLESFIQACQQGQTVAAALKSSGLITPESTAEYLPGVDDEVALEELFYKRVAAKKPKVVSDEDYLSLSSEDREKFHSAGHISKTQLFKLVDWLYFVRGLPLKAISSTLQVAVDDVASVKAEISNDFSKTLRKQNAESYIGDLLRIKELLRADIMFRKSKLSAADSAHGQLNKILWELENKFIDRLQEIGIIDKTIGRVEIHEEWSVTIGAAGQPVNHKIDQLPDGEVIDIAAIQHTGSGDEELSSDAKTLTSQLLDAASHQGMKKINESKIEVPSAFIRVK